MGITIVETGQMRTQTVPMVRSKNSLRWRKKHESDTLFTARILKGRGRGTPRFRSPSPLPQSEPGQGYRHSSPSSHPTPLLPPPPALPVRTRTWIALPLLLPSHPLCLPSSPSGQDMPWTGYGTGGMPLAGTQETFLF